jgi:O-acetyl-ADP-ribose deacetylase (regulator of RNase III)
MTHISDLEYLITELLRERNIASSLQEVGLSGCQYPSEAEYEKALFDQFRTLVNTREPLPATDAFLSVQDRMLQERIKRAGITEASQLPRTPVDNRLSLWRGDITTLRADAIVNAANSQMLGCWVPGHYCIDNAIHTFAGIQLRLECASLMAQQGFAEPTGNAKVTNAYNLPARCVIHTVGPIAQGNPSKADIEALAQCYLSCLDAAAAHNFPSIAFCCISTGVFGFPQEAAAFIAFNTVRLWLDSHDQPLHVIFNVFTQQDEGIYRDLLFNPSH